MADAHLKIKREEGRQSTGEKVREAVFGSRLQHDLSNPADLYTQQDAAAVLQLLMDILNDHFEIVEQDAIEGGVIFPRAVICEDKLAVRIKKNEEAFLSDLISHC